MKARWLLIISAILAWLIGLMDSGARPQVVGMVWQYLATLLAYPFADYLIERFEDADVRFR